MKDYTSVAGKLGVSHVLLFSQTTDNLILRIGKIAEGPTLHFKIAQYSLASQIRAIQKRPYDSHTACK